jgi:integrase
MAGKQAKVLSATQQRLAVRSVARHRYSERDCVLLLLSLKAGLRAGEIAQLTWPMVLDAEGRVGDSIELADRAAKMRSGRTIPLNPALRAALVLLRNDRSSTDLTGPIIRSERRSSGMTAGSVVNWFAALYRKLGFTGCSSHSGRRTFITKAARVVTQCGGSLRDVQQLAGHRSIEQTQAYIEGDGVAKRRLVSLL